MVPICSETLPKCVKTADHCHCHDTGLPVLGEIDEPGFLEGGDYFAAGEDLALVGVGLRSNIEACEQLMNRDWLGTDRLAVVRDDFEQHQVSSIHLCSNTCWPYRQDPIWLACQWSSPANLFVLLLLTTLRHTVCGHSLKGGSVPENCLFSKTRYESAGVCIQ